MGKFSLIVIGEKDNQSKYVCDTINAFDEDIDGVYTSTENFNTAYLNMSWDNTVIINDGVKNNKIKFKYKIGKTFKINIDNESLTIGTQDNKELKKILFEYYLDSILDKEMLGIDSCGVECYL